MTTPVSQRILRGRTQGAVSSGAASVRNHTDGLASIQSASRTSASRWRQWCSYLELDPSVAVELWEGVCHPLTLTAGRVPDVALLLQLRAARRQLLIEEFREELPAVLCTIGLLDEVFDEQTDEERADLHRALLRLCRIVGGDEPQDAPPGGAFVVHAGVLTALSTLLPGRTSWPRLIHAFYGAQGLIADPVGLARAILHRRTAQASIARLLEVAADLITPPAGPSPVVERTAGRGTGRYILPRDGIPVVRMAPPPATSGLTVAGGLVGDVGADLVDAPPGGVETPEGSPWREFVRFLRPALASALGDATKPPAQRGLRLAAIGGYRPLDARVLTMEEILHLRQHSESPGGGRLTRGTMVHGGRTVARPQFVRRRSVVGLSDPVGAADRPDASRPAGEPEPAAEPVAGPATVSAGDPTADAATAPTGDSHVPVPTGRETPARRARGDAAAATEQTSSARSAVREDPSRAAVTRLTVPEIEPHRLGGAVARVAEALRTIRDTDRRVWQLLTGDRPEIEDLRALAEDLAQPNSAARRAGDALRQVAQQQRLRDHLDPQVDEPGARKPFDVEVESWIDNGTDDSAEEGPEAGPEEGPEQGRLLSLPTILDHAAAALVRAETLRTWGDALSGATSSSLPDPAVLGGVDTRRTSFLRDVVNLADEELVSEARRRADEDLGAMLKAAAVEARAEQVRAETLTWVRGLLTDGVLDLAQDLEAALAEAPPGGEPVSADASQDADPLPESVLSRGSLGARADAVREHVLRAAWRRLGPEQDRQERLASLDAELCRMLLGHVRFTPQQRRHERAPRRALPVVSLAELSGNPDLAHLFVRVTPDGRLLASSDDEGDAGFDIYEEVENRRRHLYVRAYERTRGEGRNLLTGASYLQTRGRTRDPFAATEQDLMAACVRDEAGEVVLFEPF